MSIEDLEFLFWMSKRLVYRYKENPEILSITSQIVNKITKCTDSNKEISNDTINHTVSIKDSLNKSILAMQNLQKILNSINSSNNSIQETITKNHMTFKENITTNFYIE